MVSRVLWFGLSLTLLVFVVLAAVESWSVFAADPNAEIWMSGKGGSNRHTGPALVGAIAATVVAVVLAFETVLFAVVLFRRTPEVSEQ